MSGSEFHYPESLSSCQFAGHRIGLRSTVTPFPPQCNAGYRQKRRLQGIEAVPVLVEVNSGESGDPRLIMVGLADTAVKESDDRVFSALANSGFRKPQTRTTINLAPGDLKKEGPMYDLPIALGILESTGQISASGRFERFTIAGELSLSGAVRALRGGLAFAIQA